MHSLLQCCAKAPSDKAVQEDVTILGSEGSSTLRCAVGRIQWQGFGLILIYIVTYSFFPGYITKGVHSEALKDWYPILLIAGFILFDFVGRSLTAVYVPEDAKVATGGSLDA